MQQDLCVSIYKKIPWLADMVNVFLLTDLFANFSWSKVRNAENHAKNVSNVGVNVMHRVMTNALGSRRTHASNTCPSEKQIVDEIMSLIYGIESPLITGKNEHNSNMMTENAVKYADITQWTSDDLPQPKFAEIVSAMNYTDVLLRNALTDTLTVAERAAIINGGEMTPDMYENLNACLDTYSSTMTKKTTHNGKLAREFLPSAREVLARRDDAKLRDLLNFQTNLKPGSHIAYQFDEGYMHHAIYIGNELVIEVLNVNVPKTHVAATIQPKKKVQGFITINHLNHFIHRVKSNVSEFLVHTYKNPYPLDVIKRRAGWSLGRFPNYHITNENCENFAAWVMSSQFEASACILKRTAKFNPYDPHKEQMNELSITVSEDAPSETTMAIISAAANDAGNAIAPYAENETSKLLTRMRSAQPEKELRGGARNTRHRKSKHRRARNTRRKH
jgi:hypothetical protein